MGMDTGDTRIAVALAGFFGICALVGHPAHAFDLFKHVKVCDDIGVFWDRERLIFEGRFERRHIFCVPIYRGIDRVDPFSVTLTGFFRQIGSVASAIERPRFETGQTIDCLTSAPVSQI